MNDKVSNVDPAVFSDYRKSIEKKAKGFLGPWRCIDAVELATKLPMDEGLLKEREFFFECMASPQRAAQIHAFFSEREATKIPRPARGCEAEAGQISSGAGRRHHGRRHRNEFRQCRHSGETARRVAGSAVARPGRDREELCDQRGARQHEAGGDGSGDEADLRHPAFRGYRRCRYRGGSRVRGNGRQEGCLRQTRQGDEARCRAGDQHLDAGYR